MRLRELVDPAEIEEVEGDMEQAVAGLAYDSRRVQRGYLFFAISGGRLDGHDFVGDALKRGAAAVVVEKRTRLPQGATWVRVHNARRAMGLGAASFFGRPSRRLVLVGVTGTNGKTTVTYLLESVLFAAGMSSGVIGTINYRYQGRVFPALHTTPESVELQALLMEMDRAGVRSVAMEVSSHSLAQERVRAMDFDGAVFTNLSRDHLDFHGDMESYFSAKSSFFTDYLKASSKGKKFAVIHGQDPRGAELLERVRALGIEVLSYGRDGRWDIHPLEVKGDIDGLRGTIRARDRSFDFSSRLIGAANLENILAAAGVGVALGLPQKAIVDGIARLESVPGRVERIENRLGVTILVDYAHTPDALERVIGALRPLCRGRLIALFGCGGDRDRGKRPLMGEIAGRLSDAVILTSDNPRTEDPLKIIEEIEEGVKKTGMKKFQISDLKLRNPKPETRNPKLSERGYFVEPDRRSAIRLALRLARAGDLILLAGKGHEDYQILGTSKIRFDDREVAREELKQVEAA